jgi:hypothetical protein
MLLLIMFLLLLLPRAQHVYHTPCHAMPCKLHSVCIYLGCGQVSDHQHNMRIVSSMPM